MHFRPSDCQSQAPGSNIVTVTALETAFWMRKKYNKMVDVVGVNMAAQTAVGCSCSNPTIRLAWPTRHVTSYPVNSLFPVVDI